MRQRKGMGKGLGCGYKNLLPKDPFVHGLSAKGVKQKNYLKAVVKFEGMNPDYPSSQMEGIAIETKRPMDMRDNDYIAEKVRNTTNFYKEVVGNFGERMKYPETQKEFQEYLKEHPETLKAKGNKNPVTSGNLVNFIMDFEGGSLTPKNTIYLFSHLIKTGEAWTLQGMYGRQATSFINMGLIDRKGVINWKGLDEVVPSTK